MKRSQLFYAIISLAIIVIAGGPAGCGSDSTTITSDCACSICVDNEPVDPCDTEENCSAFATAQNCTASVYLDDPTDTCGDEPQPVCTVSSCTGQCECPSEEE